MTPLHWFFFGVACMVNAPTDCTRVVFDHPMEVTDLSKFKPVNITTMMAEIPLTPPLVFDSFDDCMDAIPTEFDLHKPFKVEGSEWVEIGCTQRETP
jgi:hypothetical protein